MTGDEGIDKQVLLAHFMSAIVDDTRISSAHISLYVSILFSSAEQLIKNPISIFSHQLMPICKISSPATYHKIIRDLDQFGYIRYVPSFNRYCGSLIYLGLH